MSDRDRYPEPYDETGAAGFAEELRALKARVADLEGQPLVGSQMTVKDVDGNVKARLGGLTTVGGSGKSFGLEFVNQPGTGNWPGGTPYFRVSEEGFEFPYSLMATSDIGQYVGVAVGSFAPIYRANTGLILHPCVAMRASIFCPVGTTGEIRLTAGGYGSLASSAVTIPDGHVGFLEVPAWAHTLELWTGPYSFDVEVRRTSGAGTIQVFNPGSIEGRPI